MSKHNAKPAYRRTAGAAPPLPAEYVTKQIAAKRLGLSVRRVLELSARGLLKRRKVRDPITKREQTVFRAEDVKRVVIEGNRRAVAVFRAGAVGASEVAARPPLQRIPAPPAAPGPNPDRPWLMIDEAALYSGLPAGFLLKMIGERRLAALDVGVRPGGRYRLARKDLDAITADTLLKPR